MRCLRFVVLVLLYTQLVSSAEPLMEWSKLKPQSPRGYQCRRTDTPVRVDGRLDEAAWRQAAWTEDFVDIQGASLPKPKQRTRAKMTWDDTYFYIGAELRETQIWGTITNRDAVIFQDNDFEVFIDPDGDGHDYYEFEMNALNTVWDLRLVKAYKDGGPALNEWNIAGLKTAVHIDGTLNNPADQDRFWSVEIAMPWKALGEFSRTAAPPKLGDRWRVNFSRVEWRMNLSNGRYEKVPKTPEDNWVWSPTGIIDMHRPERWGIVEFAKSNAVRRRIRPDADDAARDRLVEIYYLQRQYQARHGRYAQSLAELSETTKSSGFKVKTVDAPKWVMTADGYEATLPATNHRPGAWHIRQDAKLWKDSSPMVKE